MSASNSRVCGSICRTRPSWVSSRTRGALPTSVSSYRPCRISSGVVMPRPPRVRRRSSPDSCSARSCSSRPTSSSRGSRRGLGPETPRAAITSPRPPRRGRTLQSGRSQLVDRGGEPAAPTDARCSTVLSRSTVRWVSLQPAVWEGSTPYAKRTLPSALVVCRYVHSVQSRVPSMNCESTCATCTTRSPLGTARWTVSPVWSRPAARGWGRARGTSPPTGRGGPHRARTADRRRTRRRRCVRQLVVLQATEQARWSTGSPHASVRSRNDIGSSARTTRETRSAARSIAWVPLAGLPGSKPCRSGHAPLRPSLLLAVP